MNPGGGQLLGKLVQNKERIEDNLPWKDLDSDARLERLRTYVKQAVNAIVEAHQREVRKLEKRILDLEIHKHDESGYPIVEKRLLNGGDRDIETETKKYPLPNSPISGTSVPMIGGDYI